MKKLLRILVIICLIATSFSLVGCTKPYKGKDISSISFVSVDFMGGASTTTTFDFDNAVASVVSKYPYNEGYNKTETYPLDETKYQQLFDDLNKCGFFKLKELYKPDGMTADGGSHSITVTYADGTTYKSECINESNGIEEKYGIAFYEFCGEHLVGSLPRYYINPPSFGMDVGYRYENASLTGFYNLPAINYNWQGKKVDNINLLEAAADAKVIRIATNGSVMTINTVNHDVKPNKTTIYSYDLDGSNKQTVLNTKRKKEYNIKLAKDKIYQIIATYEYGTAEYVFCTQAEAE